MKSPRSILHTNVTKQMLLCSAFCCAAVLQAMGQFPSLSPLPSTGSLQPASDPHKFTFLVAGDNRPCKSSDPQSSTPQTIFAAAVKLNPTFVLWTGDSIYGKDKCDGPSSDPCHSSTIDKEYQAFFVIAKKAGVPVFNAPGNHEMDNKEDVPNPTMQALYAKYAAQPYGSFDYGDSHFIALNTEEVAPSGTTKSARRGDHGDGLQQNARSGLRQQETTQGAGRGLEGEQGQEAHLRLHAPPHRALQER